MRRLPIFLVLDVSESMVGQPLRTMQAGLAQLVQTLRTDPMALETVYLSVIGFAGQVKTLTPLIDLISFYPPRLPMGAGTSVGKALWHVMDEIERQVVKSSAERKGDWKPLVYWLSDGSSTDNPQAAIARWQQHFAHRATLVNIGIGAYANLSTLKPISEHHLRLEHSDELSLKHLIRWLSQSITTQSRSVGLNQKITLEKDLGTQSPFAAAWAKDLEEANVVDEQLVMLSALCSKNGLPYVLKYERPLWDNQKTSSTEQYHFVGAYPLEQDYFDWSDTRVNSRTISSEHLIGGGVCPHCQVSYGLVECGCGRLLCVEKEGEMQCPACQRRLNLVYGEGHINMSRSRG